MRILLIPDKFKGSLSAQGVIDALKKGIHAAIPTAEFFSVLASDGGDGFLNSIAANVLCENVFIDTVDPLGRKITSTYLLNKNDETAYIELAKASGLELLSLQERNAMVTSTYGTGLEIKDAIQKGATKIYVGLGGSATNDGGIGIANALGYDFQDESGVVLNPIGKNLSLIHAIKKNNQIFPADVSVFAVNDVDNPLFGKRGAAYTYGAQKGQN
nr:glycerate kinase [Maribacter sp. Hal144]